MMMLPSSLTVPTNAWVIDICSQSAVIRYITKYFRSRFFLSCKNGNETVQPSLFFKQIDLLLRKCGRTAPMAYSASGVPSTSVAQGLAFKSSATPQRRWIPSYGAKQRTSGLFFRSTLSALSVPHPQGEKADVPRAHASSFRSSATSGSGWVPPFRVKLRKAANWLSSKFKREKT